MLILLWYRNAERNAYMAQRDLQAKIKLREAF